MCVYDIMLRERITHDSCTAESSCKFVRQSPMRFSEHTASPPRPEFHCVGCMYNIMPCETHSIYCAQHRNIQKPLKSKEQRRISLQFRRCWRNGSCVDGWCCCVCLACCLQLHACYLQSSRTSTCQNSGAAQELGACLHEADQGGLQVRDLLQHLGQVSFEGVNRECVTVSLHGIALDSLLVELFLLRRPAA